MNKILSVTAMALVLGFASSAMAEGFNGPVNNGGFQGPGISVSTVADTLNMSDDAAVVLQGNIEKSLGKEKYMFKDNTGSITVEIDNEDWNGLAVTPEDVVVIKGEVDKDFFKTEVDVDVIEMKK